MDGTMKDGEYTEDEKLIKRIKERIQECLDREGKAREEMKRDWVFYYITHWDPQDRQFREDDGLPVLEVPRINQFLNTSINSFCQSTPDFKITARGAQNQRIDRVRKKQAEWRSGLAKKISQDSKSIQAIQHAFKCAEIMGRGFFKVTFDWKSPMSMDKVIKYEKISDPLSVFTGLHEENDYSDIYWAAEIELISKDSFCDRFPDAEKKSWESDSYDSIWVHEDEIAICHYYEIEEKKDTLYLLEDGSAVLKSEIKDKEMFEKMSVVDQRETVTKKQKQYTVSSFEKLYETDIPGEYVPIIPIVNTEERMGSQVLIKGKVRDLKGSQQLYDYWASCEAEWLTTASKAQYIYDPRQIEGYEGIWESSSVKNFTGLPYKAILEGQHLLPPPRKENPPAPPVGFIQAKNECIEDMKAISGMQDPSFGNVSGERSGVAIRALQKKGDLANYHTVKHAEESVQHAGKIVNSWFPVFYNQNRIEKILGIDDEEDEIEIGGVDEDGDEITLGDGEFNTIVTIGPSFSTQKEEALNQLVDFMNVYPDAGPAIGDIVAGYMDLPNAQKLMDRLKAILPPGIADGEDAEHPAVIQLQQIIQEREQMMLELLDKLKEAESKKDIESAKIEVEREANRISAILKKRELDIEEAKAIVDGRSKLKDSRDAEIKAESDLITTKIKADNDLKIARIKQEKEKLNNEKKVEEKPSEKTTKLPPINVNVTVPKGGSKKITGPNGVYTVEESDGE